MEQDSLWFVRPKPLEDEILSSWIVRLAWAQGLKLESFCFRSWGRGAQVMSGDVDLFARHEILKTLQICTGASYEQVVNTTFQPLIGTLFYDLPKQSFTSWITFLGNRNRVNRDRGLSFCPDCLRQDITPYFRRTWRLAFVTTCLVHKKQLICCCPHCDAPVSIDRWDKSKNYMESGHPITHCQRCRKDRTIRSVGISVQDNILLNFQWLLERTLAYGWVNISGKPIDALLFFRGLLMIVNILLDRRKTDRLRIGFLELGKLTNLINEPTKKRRMESLPISLRSEIMQTLGWLFEDWPHRFIGLCKQQKFSSSYLFDQAKYNIADVPFWLWEPTYLYLHRRYYAPSNGEIDSAADYLLRTKGELKKGELAKILGVSWLNKKTLNRYASQFTTK
ncbi:TniQ family protein [Undibacterium sp. Rencai35W]|uniref:TniQ family protein n=1 Tax=Undibacterium sp. Rencai35W TaxID=3413046 RepID=UPI003BF154A4